MSTTWNLGCMDCKKSIWIGQHGLNGFTFYSGEPKCMEALAKFIPEHLGHNLTVALTESDTFDDFERIDW